MTRYCEALGDLDRHESLLLRCLCGLSYCMVCWNRCPKCHLSRDMGSMAVQPMPSVSDGTLEAIRAIAAHVADSRLAMAAIRVLLEEK